MSSLTQKYFDVNATKFDSIYLNESRLARWLNQTFRPAIYDRYNIALQESGDVTDKTILDIGCGSGRYMVEYAKRGARKVVGVDFSDKMLELARHLAISADVHQQCEFLKGDFLELDFENKFDVIIAMGVFDYTEQPQNLLKKMIQLSQGGVVIASFPGRSRVRMHIRRLRYRMQNCPIFFYSEPELHQIAQKAGLTDYKLVFIPHSGTGFILIGQTR